MNSIFFQKLHILPFIFPGIQFMSAKFMWWCEEVFSCKIYRGGHLMKKMQKIETWILFIVQFLIFNKVAQFRWSLSACNNIIIWEICCSFVLCYTILFLIILPVGKQQSSMVSASASFLGDLGLNLHCCSFLDPGFIWACLSHKHD